jgi:hypothetical protein
MWYNSEIKSSFNSKEKGFLNFANELLFTSRMLKNLKNFDNYENIFKSIKLSEINLDLGLETKIYHLDDSFNIVESNGQLLNFEDLGLDFMSLYNSIFQKMKSNLDDIKKLKLLADFSTNCKDSDSDSDSDSESDTNIFNKKGKKEEPEESEEEEEEEVKDEKEKLQDAVNKKRRENLKRLNELKDTKRKFEEKKNQFEADKKAYFMVKKDMSKNSDMKMPELFVNKYPIFERLEKENTLTFENYIEFEPKPPNILLNENINNMFSKSDPKTSMLENDNVESDSSTEDESIDSLIKKYKDDKVKTIDEVYSNDCNDSDDSSESNENFMTHCSDD